MTSSDRPDGKTSAIVLLSGGLDSSTVLAYAVKRHDVYALSFNYGQRNQYELEAAKNLAAAAGVKAHVVCNIALPSREASSLTSPRKVEQNRPLSEIGNGIPSTYVPARNTLFLSYALSWADALDCTNIFIGVNAVDTSGYPDCRPEFIDAFTRVANLGTRIAAEGRGELRIHAPLQRLSKREIIELGFSLGVDYSLSRTCYDPLGPEVSCGVCDACILRRRGFEEAGTRDPLRYAA